MSNRKHGTTRTAPKAGNVYEQCIECDAERLVEKDGQALKSPGKWSARWCVTLRKTEGKKFANSDSATEQFKRTQGAIRDEEAGLTNGTMPLAEEAICDHEYPPESEFFNENSEKCVNCGCLRKANIVDGPANVHFTAELPDTQPGDIKLIDREYTFVHRANCHCTTDDRPYVCRICWEHQVRRKGPHAQDCLDCDHVVYNHKGFYTGPMPKEFVLSVDMMAFCEEMAKRRQALAEEKNANEGLSVGNKSIPHRLHMLGVCGKYVWHRLRGRENDEIAPLLLDPFTGGTMSLGVDDILPGDKTLVVRGRTATKGAKTRLTMPVDKGRDIEADFVVLVEFIPKSSRVGVMGYTRRDMWMDWREAIDVVHGKPAKTTKTWVYRGPMLDLDDLLELCGVPLPTMDLGGVL